jgi:methyl-accepting chemotaxis protein
MTNGNNLDSKLEALTDQVGRLTKGLTEIKGMIQEQSETAKRQEHNIDRLVAVTERQSAMIERLVGGQL